jgi:hypothetical protein
MGLAQWRDRTLAELWIIGQLLNNIPSDINTDYRLCAKPWPLAAIQMKQFNFASVILLLALWSCKGQMDQTAGPVSDTTLLINQALSDAISVRFMPDADAVTRPYLFSDSILLTSKVISLDLLPVSIEDRNFKVMAEHDILRMLRADSSNLCLPNYLIFSRLEANDSGYYVQVQNLSALPFGGGGSLGMYYQKKGDSLIIVNRSASSIN